MRFFEITTVWTVKNSKEGTNYLVCSLLILCYIITFNTGVVTGFLDVNCIWSLPGVKLSICTT